MRKIIFLLLFLFVSVFGLSCAYAYDKYDGDYTIEYLLRNYSVVTFGTKSNHILSTNEMPYRVSKKGSLNYAFDVGGPVLINGDYVTSSSLNWDIEFAQKTNGVSSYIKGQIGSNVKAGSIESADVSNIYVGSSNSVSKNGDTYTVNGNTYNYDYPVYTSDDYLDFNKLYAAVINEQKNLDKGKELPKMTFELYKKYIDSSAYDSIKNVIKKYSIIEEPGVYYIDDIGMVDRVYIVNYDPEQLYLINYYGEFVYSLPLLNIVSGFNDTDQSAVYCGRNDSNDTCTGNIVWSMPNARYITKNDMSSIYGHLIAPRADVNLLENHYANTFIVNSLSFPINSYSAVQFRPYNIDENLPTFSGETYIKENDDDPSDFYEGSYSIDELLKNYSVVALGQKDYDDNAKLKNLSDLNGSVNIFHMAGEYLINGNLSSTSDRNIRLDHLSQNIDSYSYLKGRIMNNSYVSSYVPIVSNRVNSSSFKAILSSLNIDAFDTNGRKNGKYVVGDKQVGYYNTDKMDNYINFSTLYNSIVSQQSLIDGGSVITPDSSNVIHIPIGGNYTIEGINDATRIIFDNYLDNKDKLTIVTINDSGSINMPFEDSDSWSNTSTNDYFGKSAVDYQSELLQPDVYYGNIVFNIPNASYIKLASDNSFKGHIIAPNADVETPEMNFAGAMIVNSLYTEGSSEAHYYPLSVGSVGTGILPTITYGSSSIDKITISGNKYWDDNDNQDGMRPENVIINLLADGEIVESRTISEADDWKYSFNVNRTLNNVNINYTVTENAIDNYSTEINAQRSGSSNISDVFDITNRYTPKKTSVTVNKIWKDDNNKYEKRPDSITVKLFANGKEIDSVELSQDNDWMHIFNDVNMYENGEKIVYTVKEVGVVNGYDVSITGDQESGYVIVDTYINDDFIAPNSDEEIVNPATGIKISVIVTSLVIISGIGLYSYINKKNLFSKV